MDRSRVRLRTVVVALLCLAVVAFAAATLTATQSRSDFGLGSPGDGERLGGDATPTDTPEDTGTNATRPSILDVPLPEGSPVVVCVEWLTRPLVQVGIVGGFLALLLVVRRLRSTGEALAAGFVVGYPGLFLYWLLTTCASRFGLFALGDPGAAAQEGGGLTGGEPAVPQPSLPAQLVLLAVVATLVVVAAFVLTSDHDVRSHDESDDADEADPDTATDVAAIGVAAGEAADRIERDGAFENEIYRAWAEMTDHLTVDHPESSTPAEFATAAVDAGMDREDVERLTALFEEVRYGAAEPTAEREAAAVETLRRIESAYAGDDE